MMREMAMETPWLYAKILIYESYRSKQLYHVLCGPPTTTEKKTVFRLQRSFSLHKVVKVHAVIDATFQ